MPQPHAVFQVFQLVVFAYVARIMVTVATGSAFGIIIVCIIVRLQLLDLYLDLF